MAFQTRNTGVILDYKINPHVPKRVNIDAKRFKQVLFNLIGIALKFTKKGFIKVRVGLWDKKESRSSEKRASYHFLAS